MKKKIIVTILAIILLIVTAIISIYTLAFLLSLEGTRGILPLCIRQKIWGWEATYGQHNTFLLMQIIVFLFYLILFSAIIFLMVWIRRKIKH